MSKKLNFILSRIKYVYATIVIGTLLICGTVSASSTGGVKFVNPTHGPAKIKGDAITYHYFRAKITADRKAVIVLRENDCILIDVAEKKYSKCWIYIGWSAGLSVSQQAPIRMKTLSVELDAGTASKSHQWNTSMVDGSNGVLEFSIPEGGFVELYLLWEVKDGFSASGVKIGAILDISF